MEVIEDTEEPPSLDADLKTKKSYDWKVKKAFSMIACNFIDRQLAHIWAYSDKGSVEAWRVLCNIHETKSLSNMFFIPRKFLTCKIMKAYLVRSTR